jgi:hypothetical protein
VVVFLAVFFCHELVRRLAGHLATSWLFFSLVLGIGLIGPFMLASVDNVAHVIFNENFFSEGSNWKGKVEFLDLGWGLFTVFSPRVDDSTLASHNLVLQTYLQFGYLLLVPLLWLLFILIKTVSDVPNTRHVAALILIVLNNTLAVEGNMFLAIGAMNYLVLYEWVRYNQGGLKPIEARK